MNISRRLQQQLRGVFQYGQLETKSSLSEGGEGEGRCERQKPIAKKSSKVT